MADMEFKDAPALAFKADGDDVEGYGSVFGVLDDGGDVVEAGAFSDSLARMAPKMLWQHDPAEPIGVWSQAGEDATGLRLSGRLLTEVRRAAEAKALLQAGAVDGLSIGYRVVEADSRKDGARVIRKAELWEVSLVTFPMNRAARASAKTDERRAMMAKAIKDMDALDVRGLERLLREAAGFTRDEAKQFLHRHGALIAAREASARNAADAAAATKRLLAALRA